MKLDFQFILEALPDIASYIPVTLQIAAVSFVIAFLFGMILALITYKQIHILNPIAKVFISLIRGTPMILQIYVIYNLGPYLIAELFTKLGITFNVYNINNIYYAYVALALTPMVAIAEAVRSGLVSVDKGQYEAALAAGLSRKSAYLRVVFPQVFAIEIPVLCTAVINLMKSTSLAFMMAVTDITGRAKILGGQSLRYFEAYIVVFIVYILLIVIVEKLIKLLEVRITKFRRGTNMHI